MNTHSVNLDRNAYIASVAKIDDPESRRFGGQALAWWDRHFSWNAQGCDVLVDEENFHVCYLFSKVDRYGEYLTIYNLFTPQGKQRKGYAHELLRLIIEQARTRHVRRITFSSVSSSLDFYLALGFIYWGINDIGDYYCDLPIPKTGLEGVFKMTDDADLPFLIGTKIEKICAKVIDNASKLSPSQQKHYHEDRLKLGNRCKLEELTEIKRKIPILRACCDF